MNIHGILPDCAEGSAAGWVYESSRSGVFNHPNRSRRALVYWPVSAFLWGEFRRF
jgi:hypothetical protein